MAYFLRDNTTLGIISSQEINNEVIHIVILFFFKSTNELKFGADIWRTSKLRDAIPFSFAERCRHNYAVDWHNNIIFFHAMVKWLMSYKTRLFEQFEFFFTNKLILVHNTQ